MSKFRALWSLLLLCAVLASAGRASAQVSLDPILDSGVDRSVSDRTDTTRLQINYADCVRDDVMSFDLKIRNNNDYQLEVWATVSEDCSVDENRRDTAKACRLVFSDRPTSISYRADIPVQRIAEEGTHSATVVQPGANACDSPRSEELTLYFMMTNGGNIQGSAQTWKSVIDLVGPPPPGDVEASTGENRLSLEWDATNASADRSGYRMFCVPLTAAVAAAPLHFMQANTAGAGGADAGSPLNAGGTSGSSGSGGSSGSTTVTPSTDAGSSTPGTSTPVGCPYAPAGLVEGETPDVELEPCGKAGPAAGSGVATGLENGVTYAIAVAGIDDLGNRGKLSNVVCGTPEVVEDFFELYKANGGKGGGGFCAIGVGQSRALGWLRGLGLVVALGLLLRRRKDRT